MSSSLPPIKGLSALNSLSHRCPETNSSIITDNDYDGGNGDNIISFTSDNLLFAFVELLIKNPPSSLASTAAFYNIGERTLKRYQSQIASILGLSQNSSRLIRDHFLLEDHPATTTIIVNNSTVLGNMQALTKLSANPSRDVKIKAQRRIDEAMCSLPYASDDRDFRTIQEMASLAYNWQSLRFEWVLACETSCSASLLSSNPMYTSIIQALGYYLNLKTVVIPSQVHRFH